MPGDRFGAPQAQAAPTAPMGTDPDGHGATAADHDEHGRGDEHGRADDHGRTDDHGRGDEHGRGPGAGAVAAGAGAAAAAGVAGAAVASHQRTDDRRTDDRRTDDRDDRGSADPGRHDADRVGTGQAGTGQGGVGTGAVGAATGATAGSASMGDDASGRERLFPTSRAEEYGARWDAVKGAFVDEPRQAVRQADALVGEVLDELERLFREQRSGLEHGLDTNDTSTEDLRLALRRYRSFFDRLLSL
ncbi:hypothetical protein I4I73_32760 [Pseudonocardia sp. KRD-184]|nr:hypothetical protein [Pseudonocardia oceani]